jgi:hypothetical protein
MLGVVYELAVVIAEPPLEAEYQSIASPVPGVADINKVPVEHLADPVPPGADGSVFTVVVIPLDVAGDPVAQVAFEVKSTVTASLLDKEVVV